MGEGTAWLLFVLLLHFWVAAAVQARILFCFSGFPPLLALFCSNFILGFGELVGTGANFSEEFIVWVMSGFQIRGVGRARSEVRCQGKRGTPKMGKGSLKKDGIPDFGENNSLMMPWWECSCKEILVVGARPGAVPAGMAGEGWHRTSPGSRRRGWRRNSSSGIRVGFREAGNGWEMVRPNTWEHNSGAEPGQG